MWQMSKKLIFTFAIILSSYHSGQSCLMKSFNEPTLSEPTIDTTTRAATPYVAPWKMKMARRPLNELISVDRCGVASLTPSLDPLELNPVERILNGEQTNPNSWPWVVGIYILANGESFFRSGIK